jgi:hypothetical protein
VLRPLVRGAGKVDASMDPRHLATLALALVAGCASLSGLGDYSSCKTSCEGAEGGASAGGLADALPDDGALASTDALGGNPSEDAPPGDSSPDDARPGDGPCEGASCTGPSSDAAGVCAKGSCNRAGGACLASDTCYCARDTDCLGGKCVVASGKNDVSCGSGCTGTGAADGFQCMLGGSGIPASCSVSGFAYTPSSLTPSQLSGITTSAVVDLGCAGTVTFNGSSWSGATCSQTLPAPHTITQTGGPSIDVLAFQSLSIASGVTVDFTGTNAVMILVFGNASVAGSIHADGGSGVANRSSPGASGPGGGYSCGGSAGGTGGSGHTSGGGGAGAQTAGGAGAGGVGGTGGAAGTALTSTTLRGGCPGGASGDWACTTSGGGGGGALQISVAGTLTLTGAITANGGTGGTSNCASGGCAPGPNHTFGGGGGGGGSGGTVRLEGVTVTAPGTVTVNGGTGGNPDSMLQEQGMGGAGATSASQSGSAGTGYVNNGCGSDDQSGGGGGGGYGSLVVSSGKPGSFTCATSLTPAPVCSTTHTACLCVADTNCSSGKCVNSASRCTGTCTGSGAPDVTGCATGGIAQ